MQLCEISNLILQREPENQDHMGQGRHKQELLPFPNPVREQTCDSQQTWLPWISRGHVATALGEETKRGDLPADKTLNKDRNNPKPFL